MTTVLIHQMAASCPTPVRPHQAYIPRPEPAQAVVVAHRTIPPIRVRGHHRLAIEIRLRHRRIPRDNTRGRPQCFANPLAHPVDSEIAHPQGVLPVAFDDDDEKSTFAQGGGHHVPLGIARVGFVVIEVVVEVVVLAFLGEREDDRFGLGEVF